MSEIIDLQLKCVLTEQEQIELSREIGRMFQRRAQLEADKKKAVKQYDAEIAECDAGMTKALVLINNGYEMRNIVCSLVKIFETNTVQIYRSDTGELVKERAMEAHERQEELELEDPGPGEAQPELPARGGEHAGD